MQSSSDFTRGLKSGIPIGLGYLSVSFTFGIIAVSYGFSWWQALVISMTTVTSAGQFSGIGIMLYPGQYLEMLLSQFTINLRYSFMSISLSQKTDAKFSGLYRWLLGFMMTDEIFAVAGFEGEKNGSVSRSYFIGLSVFPYIGWSAGTLIGALLGNVLPQSLMSALSVAIYAMFVAIVVPAMRISKPIIFVVFLAILLSCLFYYVPALSAVSGGLVITICAVASAAVGALLFPVPEEKNTCP